MSLLDTVDSVTRSFSAFRSSKQTGSPPQHGDPAPNKRRGHARVRGFDTVDHDELAMFLAVKACKQDDNPEILKAIKSAAEILIAGHGAFDGPRPAISIVDQTASDIEALRADPRGYECWVNGAVQILSLFASSLPHDLGEESIGMTVEAAGMLARPRHVFGEMVLTLLSKSGPAALAMKPWARSIAANLKSVKGARPARSAKDVFPNERRLKMAAYDLAHDVFRETPLLDMLSVHVPVPVSKQARTEHINFAGPSGTGKTQFLQMMLSYDMEDIKRGQASAVLFDTDGTISHKVMQHAASDRRLAERVVYIDPTNPDMRPDVNLLNMGKGGGDRLTRYVLEALGEGFTDRQSIFFAKVTSALSKIPNRNLDTLLKFLSQEDYAHRYLGEMPENLKEFVSERLFNGQYTSTREQVVDRVSSLRDIESISGIFDADKTKLDMGEILDRGSLVIIRVNKDSTDCGGLGSYAKLVCRFYLASITMAIQARKAFEDNMPTWLYLDEIADMIGGGNDSFIVEFLIQCRKKTAGAILAYQILTQLKGDVKAAALGNTGIKLAGKVAKEDREALAGNMDCSVELFGQISKTKTHGQVACVVNGRIDQAVLARFPFGVLESLPKGTKKQMDDLMAMQREHWAKAPAQSKKPVQDDVADDENVVVMNRTKRASGEFI